jgi:hypothetical protein
MIAKHRDFLIKRDWVPTYEGPTGKNFISWWRHPEHGDHRCAAALRIAREVDPNPVMKGGQTTDYNPLLHPVIPFVKCYKRRDFRGAKIGKLKVLFRVYTGFTGYKGPVWWACVCDCGRTIIASQYRLGKNLPSTSCGCSRQKYKNQAARLVLRGYVSSAKRRGLDFSLTDEDFYRIAQENCHYCGLPPEKRYAGYIPKKATPFIYNGVDRKNNDIGYTLENCVPCCSTCNFAKSKSSSEEFLAWIGRVYAWSVGRN